VPVWESNPSTARRIAREFLNFYLRLPNYTNNFLRLGFNDDDIKNGGCDPLIGAIVAWGDLKAIQSRIKEHYAAGADHVCIPALTADPKRPPLREWRELAEALIEKASANSPPLR
jgi:probable F420-dependent oxidoreductase